LGGNGAVGRGDRGGAIQRIRRQLRRPKITDLSFPRDIATAGQAQ